MSEFQAEIDVLLSRVELYQRLLSDIEWANFGLDDKVDKSGDIEAVWLKKEIALAEAMITRLRRQASEPNEH